MPLIPADAQYTVLIIEKPGVDAVALVDRFEKEGWSVRIARSGTEAIADLRLLAPNAVICSLELSDMTGYEVLRHVGLDAATRNVVFILSNERWDLSNWSRIAGKRSADCHIEKPYSERVADDVVRFLRRVADAGPRNLGWPTGDVDTV